MTSKEPGLTGPGSPEDAQSSSGQPNYEDGGISSSSYADLDWRELRKGRRPGERYVRIVRPHPGALRRVEPGHLLATERAIRPRGVLAQAWMRFRRAIIGPPLSTAQLAHERLSKRKALAVFASDALSSSAYATEEILLVLVAAGLAALQLTLPIALAIVLLLAIVAVSYSQTIKAYPQGGGSYIVTKDNLGTAPALIAGSSLMIDYVLTVAVSVSAGVAAITSAFPPLYPQRMELAVGFIMIIMLVNLRGIRESATIFAAPTYLFIGAMMALIGVGLYRSAFDPASIASVAATPVEVTHSITLFLVLRAFASGCAALTGTEAISDGVPAFKPPEWRNARQTLAAMALILGLLFAGITVLAFRFQIVPQAEETVVSQIARLTFGTSPLYYFVQVATMLILVLAANTSFSDFPRLAYFLARDNFLPHQFRFRGDRLAFSNGIVVLSLLAIALVILFQAETHSLIPLYAVGVFISFTLSQASMVRRWLARKEKGWQTGAVINGVGAATTAVVAIVIAGTKFLGGAWVVLLLVPLIVVLLLAISRHYRAISDQLTLSGPDERPPQPHEPIVVIPVEGLHRGVLPALAFARTLSKKATAVHVTDDIESGKQLRAKWERWSAPVSLVILESPYRSLVGPFIAYLDALRVRYPSAPITVVLPEFVPRHWWEFFLHNQTALQLKVKLFFKPNVIVVDVPFHVAH